LLSQTQFLFMFLFSLGLLSLETRWTKANTRQNLYCLYCVFFLYIFKDRRRIQNGVMKLGITWF